MVSVNTILGKLTPFMNQQSVVVENQGVNDIIGGIIDTHKKYQKEYDKIYPYFIGSDLYETSKNIYTFLKKNVPYYIESNDCQYLKSPSSIVSTPSDCKSYALFSCGVLDAIKRNTGEDIEVIYRFASYDPFDKVPQHVFCVVRGEGEEFWIDPVLNKFDEKKQPNFFKDKNINNMALVGLSGVDPQQNQAIGKGETITNIFDSLFRSAPGIIEATRPQNDFRGGGFPTYQQQQVQQRTVPGINTNTILLIAAAGLGIYFLTRKK
jgi:hypothetical protein